MCRIGKIIGLVYSLSALLLVSVPGTAAGDRFTDNGDGTVTDHQLGLMWAKYDNQGNIAWKSAQRYCRQGPPQILGKYDNWRMPTIEELASLYTGAQDGQGYETDCGQLVKVVPEIRLSCGWVWSSEVRTITAVVFNFHRGYTYTDRKVHLRNYRSLPVRDLLPEEK